MHVRCTSAALLFSTGLLPAQWTSPRTPGIPRTPDGKPDLAAKAPRTVDGRPDLSGLWALSDERYWNDIGVNLGPEGVPLQPWAAALYRERRGNEGKDNPIARCMPAGVPAIDYIPTPFKLIQTPASIAILYEYNMEYRQIFTDGRRLPDDPNQTGSAIPSDAGTATPWWWKTAGLKDNTWLDLFGHPATAALRVIERFRRRDFGHMDLEIAMTDAKAYTKPWRIELHPHLLPDNELLEWICLEGNRGMEHIVANQGDRR